MKKTTLLMKNLAFNLNNLQKLKASLLHSLRLEKINISDKYDENKTKKNSICFNEEILKMNQDENERLLFVNNLISEYEKLLNNKNKKITLTQKEAKQRLNSQKYLETKISDEEFQSLLKAVQSESSKENIENLKNRFNILISENKVYGKTIIQNMKTYSELVEKAGNAKEQKLIKKIIYNEMLLKIPSHNQITNVSHEDLINYSKEYMKSNFPIYKVDLIVGHEDEEVDAIITNENINEKDLKTNQHIHLFHSTKNKDTNEYDFYLQQYLFIKNNLSKLNISEADFEKNIGTLENGKLKRQHLTQVRNQGILFQQLFYQDINENLFKNKGITAFIKDKKEVVDINYNLHTNGNKATYNNLTLNQENQEKNRIFLRDELLKVKEQTELLKRSAGDAGKGQYKKVFDKVKTSIKENKNLMGMISSDKIETILNEAESESLQIFLAKQDITTLDLKPKNDEISKHMKTIDIQSKMIEEGKCMENDLKGQITHLKDQNNTLLETTKRTINEYDRKLEENLPPDLIEKEKQLRERISKQSGIIAGNAKKLKEQVAELNGKVELNKRAEKANNKKQEEMANEIKKQEEEVLKLEEKIKKIIKLSILASEEIKPNK